MGCILYTGPGGRGGPMANGVKRLRYCSYCGPSQDANLDQVQRFKRGRFKGSSESKWFLRRGMGSAHSKVHAKSCPVCDFLGTVHQLLDRAMTGGGIFETCRWSWRDFFIFFFS